MIVIPAIDLLNGRCVRLTQGQEKDSTVYSHDPAEIALQFQKQGAAYLHLVNLDGAFGRENRNIESIKTILGTVDIPVELGGGLRHYEDACKWIDIGITRVILGTLAVSHPLIIKQLIDSFGPERVVAAIDAKNNRVMVKGWTEATSFTPVELGKHLDNLGLRRIIYTDISRDGVLEGPNLSAVDDLARQLEMPTIASGGFSSLEHFSQLTSLNNEYIEGAIVGKALYENKIELPDIVKLLES